ncbi:hypothetical protein E2C01_052678 [Portunus trituberculatus]|uniref:Uncharacterized protein n=1 Tax=Portunus trituberculatus TaxID=210409 RepID=A0A5B7GFA0_PORTR|nr:hypothetical protein [Portunus trituberculatus]
MPGRPNNFDKSKPKLSTNLTRQPTISNTRDGNQTLTNTANTRNPGAHLYRRAVSSFQDGIQNCTGGVLPNESGENLFLDFFDGSWEE